MKPEQQHIKIAEASGFSNPYHRTFVVGPDILSDGETGDPIPDYLNDLNAMHEAEKSLSHAQHAHFRRHLFAIIESDRDPLGSGDNDERYFVSATAAQRAEAFLKTLGLWKEVEL